MPAKILVIDPDPASRRVSGHALRGQGHAVASVEAVEPLASVSGGRPDLVILDAVLAGDGPSVVQRIRTGLGGSHVPIILLNPEHGANGRVRALRAGADDSLDRPYHPAELLARVKSLLARFPPAEPLSEERTRGRIFAFYGAKGGVGTSTIVVNVAIALQRYLGRSAALVDGALQFGDHRVFLDLSSDRKNLVDLAEAASIDSDFVQSVMTRHDSEVDVLLGPPSPESADLVTDERLSETLKLLRSLYDYVIVDMDHRLDDLNLRIMEEADTIFVILTADLPCLKNGRLLLETTEKLDFRPDKIQLVLNRSTAVTGIKPASMEAALERTIDHYIVNDYYRAISSLNSGTPFMFRKPDSKVGRSILEFARAIDSWSSAAAPKPARKTAAAAVGFRVGQRRSGS